MLVIPLIILSGLVIGVMVAAPVGPVNILCIQRTLQRGFWGGVASGLGAVLGDGILAATAAFGIKEVSGFFDNHTTEIQFIGGFVLIIFGARLYFKQPTLFDAQDEMSKLSRNAGAIPQSFFMTITNPGALLFVFALFGMLAASFGAFEPLHAFILVIAVMVGSAAWWCALAWLISAVRHRVTEKRLSHINRIAASVLVFSGIFFVLKITIEYLF